MELSPSLISHQASVDVKPYLLLPPDLLACEAWQYGARLVSRRTSVQSASVLLSLKKKVDYGRCLVTLPTQLMKH